MLDLPPTLPFYSPSLPLPLHSYVFPGDRPLNPWGGTTSSLFGVICVWCISRLPEERGKWKGGFESLEVRGGRG